MDPNNANQRGAPIELSMGDSCPANETFSSSQPENLPPFTLSDLPKIALQDVQPPLRHLMPKIPMDKTRVPGEPKPKRRCLCGKYQPSGSESFSNQEMSVDKDDGPRMYDSDTGSTANSTEPSNLDLDLKI